MLGECKREIRFFSFSLPEVVSTRFISLVATRVHSSFYGDGKETVNVDLMRFIPMESSCLLSELIHLKLKSL